MVTHVGEELLLKQTPGGLFGVLFVYHFPVTRPSSGNCGLVLKYLPNCNHFILQEMVKSEIFETNTLKTMEEFSLYIH